ncbi:DEAD/DEAH box helicase [Glycomyces sp. TRM65418]|uniref:DEAD/DEAH box helicase n=1 Tax=Glycomyces sp. TRM65418 TaxID=2867006 RepID=UPI001CE7058F|nr:DEAD/DEAH box helicase [Glycomyces sp. TRM65418]MCC3765622.1 DEAD/DEAH box helicase [Glycomyces sp. TRM65418]QZD55221.1 DEAD/DEAH box helicase [Glycomyces sp. TRM65418]
MNVGKRKIGPYARDTIARAHEVSRRGAALLTVPARLRKTVERRARDLTGRRIRSRLGAIPIADLAKLTKPGTGIPALEQAGYATVADLDAAADRRLLAIPGVAERTVQEVRRAIANLTDEITAATRIELDPEERPDAETSLLTALVAERATRLAVDAIREPLSRYDDGLDAHLPTAERATSRWRMFWTGRRRRARVMRAFITVESIADGVEARELVDAIAEAERRADLDAYDADAVWREFESDAAYYMTALATISGADVADFEALDDFVDPEQRRSIESLPLDDRSLRTPLRRYQRFGAQYALHQRRAILGDEMGLGKTVQALAVCSHLASTGRRHFLVVCPASVHTNWMSEIRRHTTLQPFSLHGPSRDETGEDWLREGGVAVTTYDTLHRLEFLDRAPRAEISALIVDEAHFIKNPQAKRSAAVTELGDRAHVTLYLTGTPMENRVEEFRSLISYLRPDLADRVEAGGAIAGAEVFRRLVAPVYLRRNQEDVLDELPERIEVEDWVQLTDPARYRSEVKAGNVMGMRLAASAITESEKLERLAEIVDEAVGEGHKIVVFTYFLEVLEAVDRKLGPLVTGRIDGQVPPSARHELIERFARTPDPAVLLAQIEAGGVGMNLQAASVVVLCEPQWKPSTEEQAIARAHRMGQARRVQVHRLLAKDSVDERIREVQQGKELLFDHYARTSEADPDRLDDEATSLEDRAVKAERLRLGLD